MGEAEQTDLTRTFHHAGRGGAREAQRRGRARRSGGCQRGGAGARWGGGRGGGFGVGRGAVGRDESAEHAGMATPWLTAALVGLCTLWARSCLLMRL